jgi:hypothetical protein
VIRPFNSPDLKTSIYLVAFFLVFITAGIAGGEGNEKMKPEIPLPSEAEGWKWDGKQVGYNSKTVFAYIDGAAELYLAYGFQNLIVRRFEKSDHPPITVEVYEMASSEDAYGVFSFDRLDEPAGIGQGSEFGGGLLRFWKGKYFVSIYAEGEGQGVNPAILKIGRMTADSIPAPGPEPKLVKLIAGKDLGLVERSVHYLRSHILLNQRFFIAHKNILNLNRRTEAVLSQYIREGQKTQLLLIRYPDPKDAGDAYDSFMKAYLPDAQGKDRLRTEDLKWTIARQKGEFVLIVFGSPTEAFGETLLKATERSMN